MGWGEQLKATVLWNSFEAWDGMYSCRAWSDPGRRQVAGLPGRDEWCEIARPVRPRLQEGPLSDKQMLHAAIFSHFRSTQKRTWESGVPGAAAK